MNYVYFQKRAVYVASVAESLSAAESLRAVVDIDSIRVVFFKGDLKKPILTFKTVSSDDSIASIEFRLFFGVSCVVC